MRRTLIVIVFAVVLAAVAAGFVLVGPPAEERARRLDARRTTDLQRLRLAADLFWTRNGRLPATLEALAQEAGTGIYSRDPESGEPYEYTVGKAETYELCATFARGSRSRDDFWSHAAGRRCFQITPRKIGP